MKMSIYLADVGTEWSAFDGPVAIYDLDHGVMAVPQVGQSLSLCIGVADEITAFVERVEHALVIEGSTATTHRVRVYARSWVRERTDELDAMGFEIDEGGP